MPQAVVAAPWFVPALLGASTAAAGVGAAALGARASNRSTSAQQNANSQALAYEREREAAKKARYAEWQKQRQASFDAWYARVGDAGIRRYGVPAGLTLPGRSGAVPGGVAGGPAGRDPSGFGQVGKIAPFGQPQVGATGGFGTPPPQAGAAGLFGAPQAGATAPMAPSPVVGGPAAPPQSLAQMGGWNDWNNYLRPRA